MISLQEYLKKYSTISNKFVDDFFGLYDVKTKNTDFIISLDIIAKWLKSTKGDMNKTLTNSYVKNVDYKILKGKSTGGRPSDIILLTPDCFKRLCMLSRTKKAEEVRTYFLEIEKHLDKYKNYIIDALNAKVGVLKNNQKPKINKKGGIIYILEAQNTDVTLYKLGKTTDIRNRLNTYNSGNANDVTPLFIFEVDDVDKIENCIKLILKDFQYRKYKEVYEVNLDVIKKACEKCDSFIDGFKQVIAESKTKKDKAEQSRQIKKLESTNKKLFLHIDKK
jgi:phage anti-repressor protein